MTTARSLPMSGEPAPAWRLKPTRKTAEAIRVYCERAKRWRETWCHRDPSKRYPLVPVTLDEGTFTPARIVCGGWDYEDGIEELMRLRWRLDDGHIVGYPAEVEVYIVGDKPGNGSEAHAPLHSFDYPHDFDGYEAWLRFTPHAVRFEGECAVVCYSVEGV